MKDYTGEEIPTIRNVSIGDRFKYGKVIIAKVIDFHETKSMVTGNIISIKAIAVGTNTIAKNSFEVPFTTVVRYKLA